MVNKELLLEHILKSDLTATEKRYLEKLIDSVKWISVKERLPDIDKKSEVPGWSKEVIGYHRQYGIVFCYCRISTREWMLSKSCHITSKITHWMPLPEPPEGESES